MQHKEIGEVHNLNLNQEDHQYRMKYYFIRHNWNNCKKKKTSASVN